MITKLRFKRLSMPAAYTQYTAARLAKIAESRMSKLETGKLVATEKELEALAAIYNCEPQDLIGELGDGK